MSVDLKGKVYVQYDKATNLNALLDGLEPYLTIDVDEFYEGFFDIDTCNAQGLDNWGLILDISRTYEVPDLTNVFGFDNGDTPTDNQYPCNFGMGNFWGGQSTPESLSDDDYRELLKFRYASLTTNCSLASLNKIMNVYVQALDATYKSRVLPSVEFDNMLVYEFNFTIPAIQRIIFTTKGVLPVPVGYNYKLEQGVF